MREGPEREPRHSEGYRKSPCWVHSIYHQGLHWAGSQSCHSPVWVSRHPTDAGTLRRNSAGFNPTGASRLHLGLSSRSVWKLCHSACDRARKRRGQGKDHCSCYWTNTSFLETQVCIECC